jgi:hypothetical protein
MPGDVKGWITRKVGPLPLWAYPVGGAVALFVLSRASGGRSGAASSGPAPIRIPTIAPGSGSSVSGGSFGDAGRTSVDVGPAVTAAIAPLNDAIAALAGVVAKIPQQLTSAGSAAGASAGAVPAGNGSPTITTAPPPATQRVGAPSVIETITKAPSTIWETITGWTATLTDRGTYYQATPNSSPVNLTEAAKQTPQKIADTAANAGETAAAFPQAVAGQLYQLTPTQLGFIGANTPAKIEEAQRLAARYGRGVITYR